IGDTLAKLREVGKEKFAPGRSDSSCSSSSSAGSSSWPSSSSSSSSSPSVASLSPSMSTSLGVPTLLFRGRMTQLLSRRFCRDSSPISSRLTRARSSAMIKFSSSASIEKSVSNPDADELSESDDDADDMDDTKAGNRVLELALPSSRRSMSRAAKRCGGAA
ncbi:hypothetical protein PM082_010694, partial [Marasmius tenuissimus]